MLKKAPEHNRFRILTELLAGLHAANGLAHGVRPAKSSRARNPRARRFEDGGTGGSWV